MLRLRCFALFAMMAFAIENVSGQVPVRDEPRHKPVLVNEYFRLLDVWLPPGDTTMFHVHATPSLFVVLGNAKTSSQIQNADWVKDQYAGGKPWYRSFINDTFIHRVANVDTVSFHVNDIELLSPFDPVVKKTALPFDLLFENDKAFTYQLTKSSLNNKVISARGPMIAEMIAGSVKYNDASKNTSTTINQGKYYYIAPNSRFYFSPAGRDEFNLVLFEIK